MCWLRQALQCCTGSRHLTIRKLELREFVCYGNKESRKRQGLYLRALKKNSIIMDSSSVFSHTFSAAEIFKVILGILSLQESFSLPEILNKGPFKNTLVMNVSKIGSNGCLLLERS